VTACRTARTTASAPTCVRRSSSARANSKAGNDLQANGCTVADDVDQCAVDFANKPLHYLACVAHKTDDLRVKRVITGKEQAGIIVCTILNGLRH